MLRFRKIAAFVLTAVFLIGLGIKPAAACVGRKLTVGHKPFTEQKIMAELLAKLIEERTGTKVVLKEVSDTMEAQRALENNEIQLYVEYTGVALKEILGAKPEKDANVVYTTVKDAYSKNFNFIWLKTLGFNTKNKAYQEEMKEGLPLFAAPVVREETLKKFPALARLINQLSGKITNNVMDGLVAKVEKENKPVKDVAGQFLNSLGISFSFTPGEA